MFPTIAGTRQLRQTTIEEQLLTDPEAVQKAIAEARPDDPVVKYVGRLIELSTRKTIHLPCGATPINGCGKAATEAVIPVYGGNYIVGRAIPTCANPECVQQVIDSLRVPSEVVHLSFKGIEEFHQKFGSRKVRGKLIQLLGQGWGIVAEKRRLNREALSKFFSEGESTGESFTTPER